MGSLSMHYTIFIALLFATSTWSHPIIDSALKQETQFRLATKSQINDWLNLIKIHPILSDTRERVLEQLHRDLDTATQVQKALNNLPSTWSAKTHKLVLILPAAIELFNTHSDEIMRGQLPLDLRHYWDLPRQNNASNLRELALKACVFVLLKILDIHPINSDWLDHSATTHTAQLPSNLHIDLSNWSFFYNDTRSPVEGEIAFVHGGYAFGGQREDTRYLRFGPFGKPFGPQDCSSWISKLLGLSNTLSTVDFMNYFDKPNTSKELQKHLSANTTHIEPGMIFLTRNIKKNSGHIMLVLEVEHDKLLVLEYSRDLPRHEGFGLRHVSAQAEAHVRKVFFTVKEML